ncbi:MAG: CGNR zinc finger domain-containing protein [Actinomycetota bacterium]
MAENDAPGRLKLVQDFVNTADLEATEDDWSAPGALASWATSHGLPLEGPVTDDDVVWARKVREALRVTIEANNGNDPDPEAVKLLDEAGVRARFAMCFDTECDVGCEGRLEPRAPGVDGAIGLVLAEVYKAMENGTWSRLKACRRETCRWAFYDHARNRSGKWCSMAVCGNREKAKSYRARRTDTK